VVRQVVLDCEDPRTLAEFYRQLLGLRYRAGDEPPAAGDPDPLGQDWLCLHDPDDRPLLAFQKVDHLPESTWPDQTVPQMLHLDTSVETVQDLHEARQRALELGARDRLDRSDDDEEPLFVLVDPAGHPFCIFVA
jgi:catechol 2,3-dioxygenase-like lactoylglutathione lyase family enzyme